VDPRPDGDAPNRAEEGGDLPRDFGGSRSAALRASVPRYSPA
jgi:hypothetical protein